MRVPLDHYVYKLRTLARLQAEYADERRRAAKYPSYASLGVRTRRLIERHGVSATLELGAPHPKLELELELELDSESLQFNKKRKEARELHPHATAAAVPAGLPSPLLTRRLMGGNPAAYP